MTKDDERLTIVLLLIMGLWWVVHAYVVLVYQEKMMKKFEQDVVATLIFLALLCGAILCL